MKIIYKLSLGFGFVLAVLTVVAVYAYMGLTDLKTGIDKLTEDRFPKVILSQKMTNSLNDAARALRNLIISDDAKEVESNYLRIEKADKILQEKLDTLIPMIKLGGGKEILADILKSRDLYYKDRQTVIDLVKAGDKKSASDFMIYNLRKSQTAYFQSVNLFVDRQIEKFEEIAVQTKDEYSAIIYTNLIISISGVLIAFVLMIYISRSIIRPVLKCVDAAGKIADGDLSMELASEGKDETSALLNAMNKMKNSLRGLINETDKLTKAASDGKLDQRADTGTFKGDYKKLADGLNNTLNSILGPLNVAAEYMDRISKGDIPPKITEEYKGDFNEIKNNLNVCIDSINAMTKDVFDLSDAASQGKLDKRANSDKHSGDFRKIISGLNSTLDNVIGPLNVAAEYVDRISKGDIPPKINDVYKGDFNEIKNNLNLCIDSIQLLADDTLQLADAATHARLRYRAPENNHNGEFKKVIHGVNKAFDRIVDLLDNIDAPIMGIDNNYDVVFMNKMGASIGGFAPSELEKTKCYDYFKTSQCNTDECACSQAMKYNRSAVNETDAHPAGLDLEIKYSGFPIKDDDGNMLGAFEIVIDQTSIKQLHKEVEAKSVETESKMFWFEQILDSIPYPVSVTDTNGKWTFLNKKAETETGRSRKEMIGKSCKEFGAEGCRDERCGIKCLESGMDTSSFKQKDPNKEYRVDTSYLIDSEGSKIGHVEVFQDTTRQTKVMNYQISEVDRLASNLQKIAMGDTELNTITAKPDTYTQNEYKNFNKINDNLILVQNAIKNMLEDANLLSQSAVNGNLANRADETRHNGDFKKIIHGVNLTLDAVIEPLEEAGNVLRILATGDLTAQMKGKYKGDLESLKTNVNTLGISLQELILQVMDAVSASSSASIQISSTAESLAASTQEQSAQSDEVASAVEQMSRTITENALGANRTAEVADRNKVVAAEGGNVVANTLEKMRDIAEVVRHSAENIGKLGESSKQIGEIILVIDDIADQTNLLALNAAIEAARAGEQGRGFAVVADEVRKLAERTTAATKQIADMIQGIQLETQSAVIAMNKGNEEVSSGIILADKAGNALKQIVASSQEVLDMINSIAAASEQQSVTSEEISKNVSSISKVTAESAQRIEEVAHSAEQLSSLTDNLNILMSKFKTE